MATISIEEGDGGNKGNPNDVYLSLGLGGGYQMTCGKNIPLLSAGGGMGNHFALGGNTQSSPSLPSTPLELHKEEGKSWRNAMQMDMDMESHSKHMDQE